MSNGKHSQQIGIIQSDISSIKDDIKEIKNHLENKFVYKEEFHPIRMIVYGMTGLTLTAVITSIIYLVVT